MDTLLFNDPKVKKLAFEMLGDCVDLQSFGKMMLELLLNSAISAQADAACCADYGEKSPDRLNSRNGYRERSLMTSVGDIKVKIPKLRSGTFFPEDIIRRYCRIDRALIATIAEMYVMGVSTRKVEKVAEQLGINSLSKSQVSRMCEFLDDEVTSFRRQRLAGVRFAYLWLDATYVKCRVDNRSVSQAVVTAIGLDETGHKRFLGLECIDTESYEEWKTFLLDLRTRGIEGVQLVISDAHAGLKRAISEVYQNAGWQRCITHLMRNVSGSIHKKDTQKYARELLKATFAQKNPLVVKACYQLATETIATFSQPATKILLEAEESALSYLGFPQTHRVKIRTNNVQERANREIKRRYRVVQSFPSRESLIRLVGAGVIEINEEWSLRCTISRPSLTHAWKKPEQKDLSEEELTAVRKTASKIIQGVIDQQEVKS